MRRSVRAVCVVVGLATWTVAPDAGAALYPLHEAPPRVPQVPVAGNVLQQRLDGFEEQIVVTLAQVDGELFARPVAQSSTYTFVLELMQQQGGVETGVYNGHDANPTHMRLFTGDAHAGSFAVVSYRTNPTRAVVNRFNENAELLGTTSWLGGDRNAIGVYAKGPLGTVYSQDSRNPGASAQWLFFAGTGMRSGSCWLAAETTPLTGAGGGYDDVLCLVEQAFTGFVTPVARTSWGELKSRFR